MRNCVKPLVVFILFVIVPLPAWSIIIRTKDGKVYKGYVVKKDFVQYTIRLDGSDKEINVKHFDILNTTEAVDPKDLEKLNPDNPKSYYDHALTLISRQDDPEARDVAQRLFLISAYLAPKKYGYDALLKMTEVARSAQEAQAFRALAYVFDLIHEKSNFGKPELKVADEAKARAYFLKALTMLRRGKTKLALKYAQTEGAQNYFAVIPGLMSYKEFVKLCKDFPECIACSDGREFCSRCGGDGAFGGVACTRCKGKGFTICKRCQGKPARVKLSPHQLELILKLQLLDAKTPNAKLNSPTKLNADSWSSLLSGSPIEPVPVLSLIHLTEFDPRKHIFRDGDWVAPK